MYKYIQVVFHHNYCVIINGCLFYWNICDSLRLVYWCLCCILFYCSSEMSADSCICVCLLCGWIVVNSWTANSTVSWWLLLIYIHELFPLISLSTHMTVFHFHFLISSFLLECSDAIVFFYSRNNELLFQLLCAGHYLRFSLLQYLWIMSILNELVNYLVV